MTQVQEVTPTIGALYQEILATPEQVERKIDAMAAAVAERYQDERPLFVCLLRGGAPFATRLMSAIARQAPYFQPEMDYMTVKTYDDRDDQPSQLVMDLAPSTRLADRRAVLLDDTLDKGVTAAFASDHLRLNHGASEVDLIVMVQKNRQRQSWQDATMYGFDAPGDKWLTGMGLDDARIGKEANRWAGYIAVANN